MMAFNKFFQGLQRDLKAFTFWWIVFTLFRVMFIITYISHLGGIYVHVPEAILLGFRLSLKTAGMICAIGFVVATLAGSFVKENLSNRIRLVWHSLALLFFSICFFARISYYKIFNSGFNMMLINGMHDDIYATFITAVQEYQLWWRLPAAIVMGVALSYLLKLWCAKTPIITVNKDNIKYLVPMTIIGLPLLFVFTRYGGAFSYANSVNWESAARFNSNLLNEAVLDDGQALYRVKTLKKRLDQVRDVDISKDELREKIAAVGGNSHARTIDEAFTRTVAEQKFQDKPDNIILIIGESYGQWPFLPKFKELDLVDDAISFQESDRGSYVNSMLANGNGTMTSLNGMISGLPSCGVYENYQPVTFKEIYKMGMGYILKQLGYKTVFWYGGFSGWQNIKKYVLAQSFDEFHCADEFSVDNEGNAWGCTDEQLFKEIAKYMEQQPAGNKVFHAILTTSNHPPYSIDVKKAGFDTDTVKTKLTGDIPNDNNTLNELGHIWYADRTMGRFIKNTEKTLPKSVFIITGDHSERFTFAKEQDTRTLSAIPCIFYGYQIRPDLLKDVRAGCHMQLAGTLAEMYGASGFTYSSILPSMFESKAVFNYKLWAEKDKISFVKDSKERRNFANNARKIAAWRSLKGDEI